MHQYQLNDSTGCYDPVILLHKVNYSQRDFQRVVRLAKFDLGHHVYFEDVVKILCSKYGFEQIISTYV